MKKLKIFAAVFLAAASFAAISCETTKEEKKEEAVKQKPISEMTQEEYIQYLNDVEEKKKQESGTSFVDAFKGNKPYSQKKRERMTDVSKPVLEENPSNVFPWKDGPSNRSSELRSKESAIYDW